MYNAMNLRRRILPALITVLTLLTLASCIGIRIISDYDEATDKNLTVIQHKTDDFIEMLIKNIVSNSVAPGEKEKADVSFEKHRDFYGEIDRLLRRLEFRVSSIPQNNNTIELVGKIRAVILGAGKCSEEGNSLRDLHCMPANKIKGPSPGVLEIARRNINQTISAALSLELAKKQGLK